MLGTSIHEAKDEKPTNDKPNINGMTYNSPQNFHQTNQ
jgi:hypothetical protein